MQEYDVSCTKHERSVSRTLAFEHGASPLCRRVAVINNCCVGIVCRCMAPCRLTRIVQERAKSCPSNRTTMGIVAHFSCRQRHPGRHHFGCMTPCRLMRIARVRAKSCPCNRTTRRSIARAPKYRRFCLRPRRVPFGRLRRDLSNVCYHCVR